jgi:hypothetical protein
LSEAIELAGGLKAELNIQQNLYRFRDTFGAAESHKGDGSAVLRIAVFFFFFFHVDRGQINPLKSVKIRFPRKE